jgi:GT2 family glycosyltransferase
MQDLKLEIRHNRPWFYFDPDYYIAQCVQRGTTPQIGSPVSYLQHYLLKGARAGLSPNPFFDEDYYRQRYPEVAHSIVNGRWSSGFEHYANVGAIADYSPSWYFDGTFYETHNADLTNENLRKGEFADRYAHYLRVGIGESRIGHWTVQALRNIKPNFEFPRNRNELAAFLANGSRLPEVFKPAFDFDWMKEKYGWDQSIRPEAFVRYYILNVKSSKLSPSPYFDEAYYLFSLPEVRQAVEKDGFSCGYEHFILHGISEGRRPSRNFDPHYYFDKNIAATQNWLSDASPPSAFVHFLRNRAEKRLAISRPLAMNDVPEDMGKAVYERRCMLNAPDLGNMKFGAADIPDVSVIIVARDNYEQTANCIISASCSTRLNLEIIVFDNASTDNTSRLPAINPDIKYLSADKNLGFTEAVNRAAKLATGRMILLLNNDTEVAPFAIDRALARLEADRGIGAVGAKIVRMHGRLQEAGCIVWQDGSCLGYARDTDPMDGQVNFVRDVDFCSACFMAIMRQDWEELGGFDENFAPAYYEETDFCLRLWERGQRVVYDPQILLWHFEFGSSSIQEEALALMRKNQRYFASKHKDYLSKCWPASGAYVERARLRQTKGHRVLFIEDWVPDPMKGMGFVRSATIAKTLAETCGLVSVLGLHNHEWPGAAQFDAAGSPIEILSHVNVNNITKFFQDRAGLYDVVWLSRTHNLPRLKEWRKACPAFFADVRIVLDTEAIAAVRRFAYAKQVGHAASLPNMVQEEFWQLEHVDHVCVVSELDQRLLQDALKQRGLAIPVSILGHSIGIHPVQTRFEDGNEIVLFGAYSQPDSPNVDAVVWFDRSVRPLLQDLPGLKFSIAGSEAALFAKSSGLLHEYRIINNPVNLADVFKHARLMVAPTRFAAGIPMKVHEAASYGVPVVMTELLADQLGWRQYGAGVNVDAPEAMALAIKKTALDREIWTQCQALQVRLVGKDCDPAAFGAKVNDVVVGLVGGTAVAAG